MAKSILCHVEVPLGLYRNALAARPIGHLRHKTHRILCYVHRIIAPRDLRRTCLSCALVRIGIVEQIWEEGVVQLAKPVVNGDTSRETPSPLTITSRRNPPASGTT